MILILIFIYILELTCEQSLVKTYNLKREQTGKEPIKYIILLLYF